MALKGELDGVKDERDARAKEKGEAQQLAEELNKQVSARTAELETERNGRAAEAERVKALEGELDGVKDGAMRERRKKLRRSRLLKS